MPGSEDTKGAIPSVEESRTALHFEDKFRRIGFTCLAMIIIAALAGLFSSGYLSTRHQNNANQTLHVEYEKYGRLLKDFTLEITVPNRPAASLSLRLGKDFSRAFQIETITPQPDQMYRHNDTLVLIYAPTSGRESARVALTVKPQLPGYFHSSLATDAGPELVISQLVYP